MLAEPELTTSFDPQLQSKFFTSPTEIRHAIYAYLIPDRIHISCGKSGLRLLSCVQREKDDDASCFNQRKKKEGGYYQNESQNDPIHLRRLNSIWSTHWRCEEAVLESQPDRDFRTAIVPLFVCKRMFDDFVSAIGDTAAVYVCDLTTLQVLSCDANILSSGEFFTSRLITKILANTKSLEVLLKFPLETYQALEDQASSGSSSSHHLPTWADLPRSFQNWPVLRKLYIRLDHSDSISWSLVNERAILTPLVSLPNPQITIALPKLNPKYESPDRHFIEQGPLVISRHYRQRYHATRVIDGKTTVEYKPDFPYLHELADFVVADDQGNMDPDAYNRAILDVERMEREMILRGEDLRSAFDDFVLYCGNV